MERHNLVQGSPEWKAYRATHFNASEAPAMMGVSPYMTRTELLHQLKTGITPDIPDALQALFDEGHRTEALARPLAEEFIGKKLYPVVGSLGRLSASFDGLTMLDNPGFEHKMLNQVLRDAMFDGCTGADLPMVYQVQLEQQCMVSGALRILFMASEWNGDELVEERHCWYTPNPELAQAITNGWLQFAADLDAYVPSVAAAAPVGRTPETLPALRIELAGRVMDSNLDVFKAHAVEVFGAINTTLETDQQFADAVEAVKWCADVEARLAGAKQHALSQTETIDLLFRTIDEISELARQKRLALDRIITHRKDEIKNEIVAEGCQGLAEHMTALNARLGKPYMPTVRSDFGAAIRGKRTVETLRNAMTTELARAKIEATEIADRIEKNMKIQAELAAGHELLFADAAQILLKQPDDFVLLVKARLAAQAELEAKKAEAAKAVPVVEAAAAPAPAPAPVATQPVLRRVAPAAAAELPTLKLGTLNERLGMVVTAEFLASLGFPAKVERASRLYRESDFPAICAGISAHVLAVAKQFPAQSLAAA